ncbi:MAG TPA: HRDC domain-containing protein [Nitriliruptorales bacterium]
MSWTFVDDADALASALNELPPGPWGVDVERADSLRYHRRAALIQVGADGHAILVDPLALDDLEPVDRALDGRLCILHALINDLVPLTRAGIAPATVADTSVGAALLGLPTGLAPLMEAVLGVQLAADKDRFQRADWERRPLANEMLEYAAGDVVDLPALWKAISARLAETNRIAWYDEELAETIRVATDESRSWKNVRGLGRLRPQGRAILKALWQEREAIADTQDVAPNRILHDRVLLDLAAHPPETAEGLVKRSDRRRGVLRRNAERLFDAVLSGAAAAPIERTGPGHRWNDEDRAAHDRMRHARSHVARDIGIEPGVLCPGRLLWSAIAADPADGRALCEAAGLRQWQTGLLQEALWEAYVGDAAP